MQQLCREKVLDFDHRLLPDTDYNWYRNCWIYQNLLHNIYHHSLFGHNKSIFQRYLGFDNFQCMFQYDLLERNYNWILHTKSELLGNFEGKSSKHRNIIQHYDSSKKTVSGRIKVNREFIFRFVSNPKPYIPSCLKRVLLTLAYTIEYFDLKETMKLTIFTYLF